MAENVLIENYIKNSVNFFVAGGLYPNPCLFHTSFSQFYSSGHVSLTSDMALLLEQRRGGKERKASLRK